MNMNISDLKIQILNKKLKTVYHFTGDEWKIANIYIHKIAEVIKGTITYADTLKDIIEELKRPSLLKSKRVYVIMDDKEYMSSEKLWQVLNELNVRDVIIFTFTDIDKRSKFYKHFKDDIVTFDKLNDVTLLKYLNNATTLKNEYALKLIEICEHDYGRILLELDKIQRYNDDPNKSFELLIKNGAIYIPPKDAVFDLVDAILTRNEKMSYQLYEECKRINEANLVILLNLFNSARATYQIQSFTGNGDICQITGLKQGQIYGCQKRLYAYTNDELVYIMKLVQRIESGIKQGTITDTLSIDYLLAHVFQRR